MAHIQARQSPLLGAWWRFSTWLEEMGDQRAIAMPFGAFFVYRIVTVALRQQELGTIRLREDF